MALTRQIVAHKHPITDAAIQHFEDPQHYEATLPPNPVQLGGEVRLCGEGTAVPSNAYRHQRLQYTGHDYPVPQRGVPNADMDPLDRHWLQPRPDGTRTEQNKFAARHHCGPQVVFQNTDAYDQQQAYPALTALSQYGMTNMFEPHSADLQRQQPQNTTRQQSGSLTGIPNNTGRREQHASLEQAHPILEVEDDPGMPECGTNLNDHNTDLDHRAFYDGRMAKPPISSRKRKAEHSSNSFSKLVARAWHTEKDQG